MRRRLFNVAAGVWLVLCMCAAVWIIIQRPEVRYGRVWGVRLMWKGQEIPAPPYRPWLVRYPPEHSFAGVVVGSRWDFETPLTGGEFYVEHPYVLMRKRFLFPFALVVVACLIRPFYLRHSLRQQQRELRGDCLACGYDLTGNTSGVCPECGTAVTKESADKARGGSAEIIR